MPRRLKPTHLRQNRTRKTSRAVLQGGVRVLDVGPVPELPTIAGIKWHPLTVAWWRSAWASPAAVDYMQTDADSLARVAVLVNAFYLKPSGALLGEIRQNESRFWLSPIDRARWSQTR